MAGERFEVVLISPRGAPLPDEIVLRLRLNAAELPLRLAALAPAEHGRRRYAGDMPDAVPGTATLALAGAKSNVLVLLVTRPDVVHALAGKKPADEEPPLSEYEPMYFVLDCASGRGWPDSTSATRRTRCGICHRTRNHFVTRATVRRCSGNGIAPMREPGWPGRGPASSTNRTGATGSCRVP